MKQLIILSIAIIFLSSCQPEDNEQYLHFNNEDYGFIPQEYEEIGKNFIFKNAQNEEVIIQSQYYILTKKYESGNGFGQPNQTESYYYDDLRIELKLMNVEIPDEQYCDIVNIHISNTFYKDLYVEVTIPYYDGQFCKPNGFKQFQPYTELTQMVINGKTYFNVKTVVPNDFFTLYNGSQIDKLYYDMDHGIIGFDDTQNNKEFRLVNNQP